MGRPRLGHPMTVGPDQQDTRRASAYDELPVYLLAGVEHVFGVVTRPVGTSNGTAVLCMHAGAQNLSSHRNGVWTRLCREIAAMGYTTLRMDFHGTGDSSGVLVDRDVSGQTNADVDAAVQWLSDRGAKRVVVVGTCWGGLVALIAAARRPEITSACLISPPLRLIETGGEVTKSSNPKPDQLGRATVQVFHPRVIRLLLSNRAYRSWLVGRARQRLERAYAAARGRVAPDRATAGPVRPPSEHVLAPLLRRNVRVHVLFGEHERTYRDLMTPGTLPGLEAAARSFDIDVAPISVHGLSTLESQDLVVRRVRTWLAQDLLVTGATR